MMLLQQLRTAIVIGSLLFCSLWVPSTSFGVVVPTQSFSRPSLCLSSSSTDTLEQCKSDLLRMCSSSSPSLESVKQQVQRLEEEAELVGVGQLAMESGLLGGEWYESTTKQTFLTNMFFDLYIIPCDYRL